ncbi:signal peptidase I [Otoolea muris]|uniref:signal peptidase I n=1 Tax=Otoolea muris TaxID=2941515 RepID=UPI0020420FFB|nr:signal peptidase I [Otoolea muris]
MYQEEKSSRVRLVVNWIVDVIVVLSIAWFVVFAMGRQLVVSGQSMEPELSQGEVVLMNRIIYHLRKPERFDIVAFEKDGEKGKYYIKRIIGMPGETIQIRDGVVYVNDQILEAEDGLRRAALAGLAEHPVTLGEDEYFLLGDNRESSEDSRFVNVGNVKAEQIGGIVWFRIRPLSRFGRLGF